jgi:hypothetical protein
MVVCEIKTSDILHFRNGDRCPGWGKRQYKKCHTLCGLSPIRDTDLVSSAFVGKSQSIVCEKCLDLVSVLLKGGGIVMNIGDVVRIARCDSCPSVVGKTAKVKGLTAGRVEVSFGRGRPVANRPSTFDAGDVVVVNTQTSL